MKHPPYHLRPNKAVDRLLLVDILRKLSTESGNFTYYSLAGPFLEDLRVMDHFFPEMKLVSIERSEQTFKRQQFNKFSSRLDLRRVTFDDFLNHDYEPQEYDVFWLDYTDLKYARFDEFQSLLTQVEPNSVIRLTLRAEPSIDLRVLDNRVSEDEVVRLRNELIETFKNEFDKVLPHDSELLCNAFKKQSVFAHMIQLMVRNAASQALDTSGNTLVYLPLQSTRYIDLTQMVSVTGIVCLREEEEMMRSKLASIRFANFDWETPPEQINIPALSVKERLHLEEHLPIAEDKNAGEMLFKKLGYMIENNANQSKKQLSHYAYCYRDYPNFIRILI